MLLNLAITAAIMAFVDAAPTSIKHILHEKREIPASDWVKGARIESTAILPIRIGLSQGNLDKGHNMLLEV
jgi:tripeptidyl-peptidase-1